MVVALCKCLLVYSRGTLETNVLYQRPMDIDTSVLKIGSLNKEWMDMNICTKDLQKERYFVFNVQEGKKCVKQTENRQ